MTRNIQLAIRRDEISKLVANKLSTVDVESFRASIAGYVATKVPEIQLKRKTATGLRLPQDDFIFAIKPVWNIRGRGEDRTVTADCETLYVEAMAGRQKTIALGLSPNGHGWRRWSREFGSTALDRFCELVNTFNISPWTVFAAASRHCCICGHFLTDPISRCRGIGPECFGGVAKYWGEFATNQGEA